MKKTIEQRVIKLEINLLKIAGLLNAVDNAVQEYIAKSDLHQPKKAERK